MSEQITPNPSVPSQIVAQLKFPRFINNLGIIPTSYKDSMSYYESLAWLCKFLEETVIPTLNENGEAVEELQGLYIELNSYVTNYFDNLDVQEEINNKLDDMVEAGTLQEIIASYLNSKAVFGFDTVAEMKIATNLINGSYAKTLGYYSANDGGKAFYKITSTLPINEYYETLESGLYAILINNSDVKNVLSYGIKNDGETNNTLKLQNIINLYDNATLYFPNGQYNIAGITCKSHINLLGESLESIIYNISEIEDCIEYAGIGTDYAEEYFIKNLTITSDPLTDVENDTRSALKIYLSRRIELNNVRIMYHKYGIYGNNFWYSNFTNVNTRFNDVGMYLQSGTPTDYYSCNIQENRIGLQLISGSTVFSWYGGQIGGNNTNIFFDNTIANQTKIIKFDGVNFEEGRGDIDIQLGVENGTASNGILVDFTLINCRFAHWTKLTNNHAIEINYGVTNVSIINCEFTNYVNAIKTNSNYGTNIIGMNCSRTNVTNVIALYNGTNIQNFSKLFGITGANYQDLFETKEDISSLISLTDAGFQSIQAYKLNKYVNIDFRTNSTLLSNGTIGTLDSKIRPDRTLHFPCVCLNGAGNTVTGYGEIAIKSNGDVDLFVSASNVAYISCCLSYYVS